MPSETTTDSHETDSRAERLEQATQMSQALGTALEVHAGAVETIHVKQQSWQKEPNPDKYKLTLYGATRRDKLMVRSDGISRNQEQPWDRAQIFDSTDHQEDSLIELDRVPGQDPSYLTMGGNVNPRSGMIDAKFYAPSQARVDAIVRMLETGTPEKPDLAITRQAKKFGKFAMRHIRGLLGRNQASSEAPVQTTVETPQVRIGWRGLAHAALTDLRNGGFKRDK